MENPDRQLHVVFFNKAKEDKAASILESRPIYRDVEMVEIKFPADSKRVLVAPAHEMHYVPFVKAQMTYAERFPEHYKAFQDMVEDFVQGTPISVLPFISKAKEAELKAINIRSAEQLAGLDDRSIGKMGMGARGLVEQAQEYLKERSGSAEIDELRRQIAEMKAQMGGATTPDDAYADYSDDDLRNMIKDAGADLPRGRAGRDKLIEALESARKEVA